MNNSEIFIRARQHDFHALCRKSSQRAPDVMITSFLHQNDVVTSFWRNNDVVIASCVPWVVIHLLRKLSLTNASLLDLGEIEGASDRFRIKTPGLKSRVSNQPLNLCTTISDTREASNVPSIKTGGVFFSLCCENWYYSHQICRDKIFSSTRGHLLGYKHDAIERLYTPKAGVKSIPLLRHLRRILLMLNTL